MLMNPAFDRPSTGRQCYLAWCRRADKAGRRLPDMPVFARSNGGAGAGALKWPAIAFSAFVTDLATGSGETTLPFFRTALSIEDKGRHGGFDPVTAADHAAEAAMRTLIRRTFPDHGIIGEEYGKERAD